MLKPIAEITSAHYDANTANGTGSQPCQCCGKEIRGEPKFWIEIISWGGVVAPVGHPDDGTSLGFFPLGPDCAKRYPAGYVHKEANA